jgi:serine/threonine-protein kinase RsbW
MDWCIDSGVDGATPALIGIIGDHLRRRCDDAAAIDASIATARRALGTAGPAWVTLTWEQLRPRLEVAPLAPGSALTGRTLRPGLTDAHRSTQHRPSPPPSAPLRSWPLAATRPAGREIGPVRLDGPSGPRPEDFVAAVWALATGTGRGTEPGLDAPTTELGQRAGRWAAGGPAPWAGGVAAPRSPAAVAEAFVRYHGTAGGDSVVEHADSETAVLVNRRCPFGAAVLGRPALCRSTSGLLGGVATALSGPVNVVIDESFALGDPQCRFHLAFGEVASETADRYRLVPSDTAGFAVSLTIRLPHDATSVPVIRHLVRSKLAEMGVVDEDVADVTLALSEACTNVVDHAGTSAAYDVVSTLGPDNYEIQVIDLGQGFVPHETPSAGDDAETGRGLRMMRALMDEVTVTAGDGGGTVVTLRKALHFRTDAPVRRLGADPA